MGPRLAARDKGYAPDTTAWEVSWRSIHIGLGLVVGSGVGFGLGFGFGFGFGLGQHMVGYRVGVCTYPNLREWFDGDLGATG